MAKQYIKKPVEVVNKDYFERLEINPDELGRSLANFTDKLISQIRVANRNSSLREDVEQTVLDFVDMGKQMKDRHQVKHLFETFTNQLTESSTGRPRRYVTSEEIGEVVNKKKKK